MLAWPEHDDRRERLEQAIEIARRDPPAIRRGDLVQELPGLVAEALARLRQRRRPRGVPLRSDRVPWDDPRRELFAALMRDLLTDPRVHWVSNDRPSRLGASPR